MKLLKRKVHEVKENKQNSPKSFHSCLKFTLITGQIFGIMPVNGVTKSGEESLYFSWKSWKVFYTTILIVCLLIPMYASVHDVIKSQANIDQITAVIFFGNSITVHILFIRLAKNWPTLMQDWHNVEVAMVNYGWPRKTNIRIKAMTIAVLSIAIVEHVLSVVNHLIIADELKRGKQDIWEYFFVIIAFPQVFGLITYSIWLGFLMQIITFASTFSWTYIDLFIALMSTGVALRFEQVANRVELYVVEKVPDETLWRTLREDYVRLCIFCKKLNQNLSYFVILSFASNIFFILVQLFHSLKRIDDPVEKIYFMFSFGFLIGRTVCVCLYGAWINDESQKPLLTLNTVSSNVYNTEIRRFILHMCFNSAALHGKHFFNVTRGLILSIAGAIMTYELILIQFYGSFKIELNRTETYADTL